MSFSAFEFASLTELFGKNDVLSPDEKFMRRKLRNRASAAASRKRKQEMVTCLKAKVEELQEENARLRGEISRLQTTIYAEATDCVSLVATGKVADKV